MDYMKCKDCVCCKLGWFGISSDYVCTGVKEPFVIKDINEDCPEYAKECWNYNKPDNTKQIKDSIVYFQNWIKDDLKELDGDTESDYAQFILDKHKYINVAIGVMEDILNK
jgi:hypothetical protein